MKSAQESHLFRTPLLALLIAALAVGSYHWVLDLGITGLDAGPLIEANRFDRGGSPLAFLGQEIRDGIQPEVGFYRPLTGFSHGLDHAIWGLAPAGHQLSQLLLHLACALALLALLIALETPAAGALLGAAWFAVHPMGVEVVPCVARRAELWMCLCLLLACLGWIRRERGLLGGTPLLVVAGLLAPLGKETGAVLPLLLGLLAAPGRRRAAFFWGLALVAPALIARTLVLGGLGGYGGWSLRFQGMLSAAGDLFNPARIGGIWPSRVISGLVLLLGLGIAVRGRSEAGSLARFGLGWMVVLLLPAAFARGLSPWYLYAALPGLAMLLGALFLGTDGGKGVGRKIASGILVVVAVVPAFLVSPMAVPYPEWYEVSRQTHAWLSSLDELPDAFFEGPQLVAGLPFRVDYPARHGVRVRAASGLSDFSLRAWTRLLLDRDSRPRNAALVEILHPAPVYSVQVSWLPRRKAARLRAQGPAALLLYDEERPFTLLESDPDELLLGELQAPLWRWNGKRLAPVPLPEPSAYGDAPLPAGAPPPSSP